mgnify:CR=1 FL=1
MTNMGFLAAYKIMPHENILQQVTLPAGIDGSEWFAKDIAYALHTTLITQHPNAVIFPPSKKLLRGELALIMYRFLKTQDGALFGYASWYADGAAHTTVPSGQEFVDQYLTVAHKTHPFGTILHITNPANGKTVDVVVNDRGPFVTGRLVDLSKTAFSKLASPGAGVISVQIELAD